MMSTLLPPGLGYSRPTTPTLREIKEEIRAKFAAFKDFGVTESELDLLAAEQYALWRREQLLSEAFSEVDYANVSVQVPGSGQGLTEPFCLCHPMSSIAFPCPNILATDASFPSSSPDQIAQRESDRIATMALNRIWEQPTPVRAPARAPFAYVNPSPPVIPSHHAHPMEPARVPYADGSYPSQTLADVRSDVIDGHLFDLNHRYIPRTVPNDYYGAAYEPIWIRAPQMAHRTVEAYQAYPVPQAYVAPIAAPVASSKRKFTMNETLATWYAEQVALCLIEPGQFRTGISGASEAVWGQTGRQIEAWERVGLPVPNYSHHYAKQPTPRGKRDVRFEAYDPYDVAWKYANGTNERLVTFITNLLQRMTIAPTAVISAVWYLHGLALHDGDGEKGMTIRRLLRKESAAEDDGVEKRVALLGLMLSGKWLDDNAFLTSSWSEVSLISKKDIDQLEFAALNDLHHSLHIPMASWSDFINMRFVEILPSSDPAENQLYDLLDGMVTDARNNELWEPCKPSSRRTSVPPPVEQYDYVDRRLEELYYAEQEDEYPTHHSRGSTPVSQWSLPQRQGVDEEMEDAARNVSALVDDEMDGYDEYDEAEVEQVVEAQPVFEDMGEDSEDESEDEFLDYDGAKRFLPSISELRRSISNSSAQSDAIAEWRAGIVVSTPADVESPPTPEVARATASAPAPAQRPRSTITIPSTLPPSFAPSMINHDIPSPYDRCSAAAAGSAPIHLDLPYTNRWLPEPQPAWPGAHIRVTSSEARQEPFDHDAYASLGRRGAVRAPIPAQVRAKPQAVPANVPRVAPAPDRVSVPKFNPTGVVLEPGIAQVRPSRYARQPLNPIPGAENLDPREAAVMAVLNPFGCTVRSRWD